MSGEETGMPFAHSIVRAQTQSWLEDGSSTKTERYFISSHEAEHTSPQRFYQIIRGHWNIEQAHWQRDTLWGEDAHQMKGHNRAHIFSSMRQLALHLHTKSNETRVKPVPISRLTQMTSRKPDPAISLLNGST